MYYAEYCRYGIGIANGRYLCRFETKEQRDGWVGDDLFTDDFHRIEISYNDARRKYPDAFKQENEPDVFWEYEEYHDAEMWPISNKRFGFARLRLGR